MSVRSYLLFFLAFHPVVFGQSQEKLSLNDAPKNGKGEPPSSQTYSSVVEFSEDTDPGFGDSTEKKEPNSQTTSSVVEFSEDTDPGFGDSPEKKELKYLLNNRKYDVLVYQECTKQLREEKKKEQAAILGKSCGDLQKDMKKMFEESTTDKEILGKLFAEVGNDGEPQQKDDDAKNMDPQAMFEKYKKLIEFVEKELKSHNSDLSTPFWERMRRFFSEPFDFLGRRTDYIDYVVGREDTTEPKEGQENMTLLKHQLRRNRRLIMLQNTCAENLDNGKQSQLTSTLKKSMADFKSKLESMNEEKSKMSRDHIKRDFWSRNQASINDVGTAFREYLLLYNFFDNHLQYLVKNDTDLKTEYWHGVTDFLKEPSKFVGNVNLLNKGSTVPNQQRKESTDRYDSQKPKLPTQSTPAPENAKVDTTKPSTLPEDGPEEEEDYDDDDDDDVVYVEDGDDDEDSVK